MRQTAGRRTAITGSMGRDAEGILARLLANFAEARIGQSGAVRLFWCELEDIRHSAELGKRTGFHFSHQVGAMHLHRRFGDANVVSNLLVEATGRGLHHDLTLAGAERVETLPERK